ncbi:hypothetical protein [Anatilimnocola floriformis]|uniref:hypothetical protein n=1 Tax=Anatilimnocola floriformis TaxID=2948575 RepID=UPI0020C30E68|nr:hypothetical protein [Anatilimnocola floriformis]
MIRTLFVSSNGLNRGATVDDLVKYMRELATLSMGLSHFDEAHSRNCAAELVNYWVASKSR